MPRGKGGARVRQARQGTPPPIKNTVPRKTVRLPAPGNNGNTNPTDATRADMLRRKYWPVPFFKPTAMRSKPKDRQGGVVGGKAFFSGALFSPIVAPNESSKLTGGNGNPVPHRVSTCWAKSTKAIPHGDHANKMPRLFDSSVGRTGTQLPIKEASSQSSSALAMRRKVRPPPIKTTGLQGLGDNLVSPINRNTSSFPLL